MIEKRKPRKITTVENQVKFSFRVPAEVYEKLEQEAVQDGRSINYQLIQILRDRYQEQRATGD